MRRNLKTRTFERTALSIYAQKAKGATQTQLNQTSLEQQSEQFNMRLRNSTDFSNERVRQIVRFVKPSGISNFDVMVKNSSKRFYGRSYGAGSSYHSTSNPFVVVRISPDETKFPFQFTEHGGYLSHLVLSREELLVSVMAHELRHQWQTKHPRGWRVHGARGQYSERDADAYAIRKVREWRKCQMVN